MRTPTAARVSLYGLLSAYTVSLFGTRLTMIALPWLVLVTTGSASQTGLIVFAEAVPLVLGKALAGPLIDRLGARRFSVAADVVSAAVIALIPLGHLLGTLPYGLLLALSTLLGLARGPGDVAKRTLTPETAEAVGMPLERVSGMVGTLERLAGTAGPAAGGAVVAFFDPVWALAVNGVTFLVSALIIAATGPGRAPAPVASAGPEPEEERYLDRLRAGLRFLRQDRLLRSIAVMLSVTNLIDAAYGSLLIPVWAKETGGGPAAIGALGSVFGIAAVAVVDGLAIGFVNPILNAVMMERIPRPLLGRVSALTDSVGSAGVPLGPILAGLLVTLAGLGPVLIGCAALYLGSTVLPALRPHWRELDHRPPPAVTPENDDHKAPAT